MIYAGPMTDSNSRYLLRIPADLREKLEQWASEDDRSLNSLVIHLLRRAVSQKEEAGNDGR